MVVPSATPLIALDAVVVIRDDGSRSADQELLKSVRFVFKAGGF
jgi:hypothetical protein